MADCPIITTVAQLRRAIGPLRAEGVALTPTMGALHEGHLALMQAARERARHVVVSIFVNPTQFAPNEDFTSYPRALEADREKLATSGTALIFAPSTAEMYPQGFSTRISMDGPALGLEADFRPHFFNGVATIVTKLLIAVMPDYALFGEKDYQQLLVVRQLVRDLALPVEIVGAPTVREPDGLAMSSRNINLSPAERAIAGRLNLVMKKIATELARGGGVAEAEASGAAALLRAGFDSVDYFALRDAETLARVKTLGRPARLLAAARIGKTRLIDNMAI
jgi:pantoate--beta-alanine ligase